MILKLILNIVMLPINIVLLPFRLVLKITIASKMKLWTVI